MSGKSRSAEEVLAALSREKVKALELLLRGERRSVPKASGNLRSHGAVGPLLASWAQERLWFIDHFEGGDAAYRMSIALKISGALSRDSLQKAFDSLILRHEILRTVFSEVDGVAKPKIFVDSTFVLTFIDVSDLDEVAREERVRQSKGAVSEERFDLTSGPLIRGRLIHVKSDEYILLIVLHHIIADGWSIEIMRRELSALYASHLLGKPNPLQPLPIQYSDYVHWQRHWLQGAVREKQLSYWHENLQSASAELELPRDRPRPQVRGYRGDDIPFVITKELSAQLKIKAKSRGMTLFMIIYASWAILLAKLSGQEDVLVGIPVANRRLPEFEKLIGLFVNTVVLRARACGDTRVSSFLQQVKVTTLAAYDHQDIPFEQVVEALHPSRTQNLHPVFQVMMTLQSAAPNEWKLPGLTTASDRIEHKTAKFDLLLFLEEHGEEIVGHLNYDTEIFDRDTVQRWGAAFKAVLQGVSDCSEQCRIAELSILTGSARRHLAEVINATDAEYPKGKPIHRIFEEVVRRTPDATAVEYEEDSLTYAELNGRASQLARYLVSQGVTTGECVAVAMLRSVEMLVAQIAILKSGGIYVPLDPEMPAERQRFVLTDCAAKVVVGGSAKPQTLQVNIRWIDYAKERTAIDRNDHDDLCFVNDCHPAAYVMYTSGSTGIPKGVLVSHDGVSRLVINTNYVHIHADDCIAHYSNPSFDASTFEVWGAILNGARVLIVPQAKVLDVHCFTEVLVRLNVTILYMSVGLFNQHVGPVARALSQLRYLLIGGDSLDPTTIRRLIESGPPQHLLNVYGPTECTTFSSTYEITSVEVGARSIPIGRPIANARTYILDRYGYIVPIGVIGELYIGGEGVAHGYLNRAELTAERFVADPFSRERGSRLYRTGDLCRWTHNETIDYLGRNDSQVKIRGFRIELGEIEVRLAAYAGVKESVVLVREDEQGDKRLVAYVSGDLATCPLRVEGLQEHLKSALPHYMIPVAFVLLEHMPLNSNGKVDRSALPPARVSSYEAGRYEPPNGTTEEALSALWREILGVERVGRHDNFFELGGHSLLVLRAVSRTNHEFGTAMRAKDMYGNPTISEFTRHINGGPMKDEIVDLIQESTLDESIAAAPGICCSATRSVLLTGCTGFVGRFLLSQVLQDTQATVYCIVRVPQDRDAFTRVKDTMTRWGLWRDEYQHRVVAIPGDMRRPRLGLVAAEHELLCSRIDTIYHCATSMNHLETYTAAKQANVDGARELLKIASRHQTKVVNVVSTLSVFGPTAVGRVVDELTPIDQEKHFASSGYAASKWVAEKLFIRASERGIPCNIFRLGLVWADSQHGRYDELQRGHRMLKSSLLSGIGIKDYRYDMPPTPVDYVARAIVALARLMPNGGGVFHVSSLSQMNDGMFERCNLVSGTSLQLLSFYDWTRAMKRIHDEGQVLPALPLIEPLFSMDEESFDERQRRVCLSRITFDCMRTQRLLEHAGIEATEFTDHLLDVSVKGILSETSNR